MRNIALKLMYNGTAYHGWQVQKTVSSVCETMEKGLSKVCGGNVKLVGCGRTDAGVHAERYIANFHTDSRIPVERLPFAINTHTPEDIVVREALEVADDPLVSKKGIHLPYLQFSHSKPLLCSPGVFLPQAAGRDGYGPGGPDV